MTEYRLWSPPNPTGYLRIFDGLKVAAYSKPSRFHLWAMRVCFGWKWEDAA